MEELVLVAIQLNLEVLVVLVVVAVLKVLPEVLVDLEIPHQHHHHREIMVELVDLARSGVVAVAGVPVELVEMQVPVHLLLVLAVLVHHLLFLDLQ
jgi:hypothetical protein